MSCFALLGLKILAYLYNTVRSTIVLMKDNIFVVDARGEVNFRIMLPHNRKSQTYKRSIIVNLLN